MAQFARDEGRYFGAKEMALRKALAEEGLIVSDEAHYTTHARLAGLGFEATRTIDSGIRELIKAYRMMRGHGLNRNA